MDDQGVIATNDDATCCKLSAVQLGYWKDDFIKAMAGEMPKQRRPPLINRGYYARTQTIFALVERFVAQLAAQGAQVVNLGAGFDTMFFRLAKAGTAVRWFDVDLPEVMKRKQGLVKNSRVLATALKGHEALYSMVSADLRSVESVDTGLRAAGLDPALPTLVLAECVLVYLDGDRSADLVRWAAASFDSVFFLNYEPMHPDDAFGQVMLRNLEQRGCPLRGIKACPDLAAQQARYTGNGFETAGGADMNGIYAMLPAADKARIERIEPLDEFEEWHLINAHYCMAWGVKDPAKRGLAALAPGAL